MPALRTTVGSRWPCLCARTTCLCWPTLSYVTPSAKPCLFCQLFLSWESLGLDIEPSTRAAMSASRACKGVSTFSWSSCQQGLPACRINGRTLGAALLHSFGWSDLKHIDRLFPSWSLLGSIASAVSQQACFMKQCCSSCWY